MAWSGKTLNAEMRSLAKTQGIKVDRQQRSNSECLRACVRQHFKAAIAQEKGRLACFQLGASKVASEHLNPMASDAEQVIARLEEYAFSRPDALRLDLASAL